MIKFSRSISAAPYLNQQGAAVLITMVVLMTLCSLLVLTSVKSVTSHALITRNYSSYESAFEAAEAGLEFGLVYLQTQAKLITSSNGENGYLDYSEDPLLKNVSLDEHTSYTITYSNPLAFNYDVIQIIVVGKNELESTEITLSILAARNSIEGTGEGQFYKVAGSWSDL
jgi:Tfp pilus assembly protein PilX